ncbi:MAG: Flp pilus assembly complex ATPase component TadA [Acidimicrobiia bacterium]|nr:Flp pilus assembly complex ATPase component TadA [Acidimicrobiia bacterium]
MGVPYSDLDELVARDMLDAGAADFLRAAVRARQSIVFAGAPGAGKTTLLSCCAGALDPSLRVVVAEEVFEIDVPLPNVAQLQTRPARAERREVDLRRLVAGFLRMAPDIAIVGEVRDREGSRRRGNRRWGHPLPSAPRGLIHSRVTTDHLCGTPDAESSVHREPGGGLSAVTGREPLEEGTDRARRRTGDGGRRTRDQRRVRTQRRQRRAHLPR